MNEQRNEVWEKLREASLKRFWLRVFLLLTTVAFDFFWLTKEQIYFTKQLDAIIFSVGFVVVAVLGLWIYFDIRIFWNSKQVLNEESIRSETERQSGKVLIQNDNLIWQDNDGKLIGTVPLNQIRAIGEYTTSSGPFVDDWFYLFIISRTDVRQVSAYAADLNSVLEIISRKYNCEVIGRLAHSTTFQSNLLWPNQLIGQSVYEISVTEKPKTIWERIQFIFRQKEDLVLTSELTKYLK